jgi:succinate dehydrogenase hydrophobic anchor subunit
VETAFGVVTVVILVVVPVYLVAIMVKTILDERRSSNVRKIWANFALSIVLCILFFVSWTGQAVSQWRAFAQEQRDHNETAEAGEFLMEFGEATLENWQSEFLQLFSFVVLAAAFIHRGSGESKDSNDRMEEMLKRVVKKLDA